MKFKPTIIFAAIIGLCLTAWAGILMAEGPKPSAEDIAEAKKNLSVIKEQLARRQQALTAEEDAIRVEAADIKETFGAQTLQGSRAQAYKKRMADLENRQARYMEGRDRLRYDIETFNAAVQEMKSSVIQADTPPDQAGAEPEVSAAEKADSEAVRLRIEQDRSELAAEWKALMEEKQQIMAVQSQPAASGGAAFKPTGKQAPLDEQLKQWNMKRNDYAKRRDAFNNAVRSYNTTTGENIKLIPKP